MSGRYKGESVEPQEIGVVSDHRLLAAQSMQFYNHGAVDKP
jgi:hypothetical protein